MYVYSKVRSSRTSSLELLTSKFKISVSVDIYSFVVGCLLMSHSNRFSHLNSQVFNT